MDVKLSVAGSLILFSPLSERGEEWMRENIPDYEYGDYPPMSSLPVELRYAAHIVEGMDEDGLQVEKLG